MYTIIDDKSEKDLIFCTKNYVDVKNCEEF